MSIARCRPTPARAARSVAGWSSIFAIGAVVLALASAGVAQTARRAANVLYIISNDARTNMNSILAYRRGSDGNLTPLPGSPFLTNGTGQANLEDVVGPLDSDQDLIVNRQRTLLFATNRGSNTIAVFRIARDGSLTHVPGSPFPSGGINPVSVGLSRNILVVVNKNDDDAQLPNNSQPNYTTFRVRPSGELVPIANSTVSIPADSAPTQALISPSGTLLFGAELALRLHPQNGPALGNPALRAFRITRRGRLIQAPGSPVTLPNSLPNALPPLPPLPPAPLGLAIHPRLPVLYSGVVTSDRVAAYSYNIATGQLVFRNAATLGGRAPCWLEINRRGTRLYSANTLTTSVSVFDLANATDPVQIQHLTLNGPGELINLTLDPTERLLYVLSRRNNTGFPLPNAANQVHVLQVGPDGKLTEAPFSPITLPAGTTYTPQGIVAI
ncbi:MAG TPA: beta-propeller fold lactonase family protein [Armatimonadota bacterium]|nr:beta-propeller fold lactonase family protein [Armatimonadota bacterium]